MTSAVRRPGVFRPRHATVDRSWSRGRDRVPPHRVVAERWTAAGYLFALLVILNVALPKGGIRVGDLPLTFGYMALGALAPIALLATLRRSSISIWPVVHVFVFAVPMGVLCVLKSAAGGEPLTSIIPYLTVLTALPVLMLMCYAPFLEDITEQQIGVILKWCIRFTLAWGLMNFALFLVAGAFIEIPFITVNAAEVGETMSKNNRRGALMKLVSTYNNGNIYGVCMVMLAPVYFYFEKSRGWLAAFLIAIACTLSRTAWFGLAFAFLVMIAAGQIRLARSRLWVGVTIVIASILLLLPLLGWSSADLIDSDLGGRVDQVVALELSLFGSPSIHVGELVYAGLFQSFGLIGFTVATLSLAFPAIFGWILWPRFSPLRRAAVAGVVSYLGAAAIDGAFVFPPTIAIFLFLTALVYRRGWRNAPAPGLSRISAG